MRILGVNKEWDKLKQDIWTTFRFPRKDKDYSIGEQVQVVYKRRSKSRKVLGIAEIINKEARAMAWNGDYTGYPKVTNIEAKEDGFVGTEEKPAYFFMWEYLWDFYGGERLQNEPMNKFTLKWVLAYSQKA